MEVTHLKKNKYRRNTANTSSHMKARVQDNREERDGIEFYKPVSTDNQVYENIQITESNLDMANSGPNEYYETLQTTNAADNEVYENANSGLNEYNATLQTTSIEDIKSRVSKSFCMTDAKQKVMLLILVMTGVLISSVSLVIALTIQEKAQVVDGSWSSWELWEACSTTCDVGMQRRHRNCSNPVPLGNGRQCLGVDNEQKLCMTGPCSTQAVDGSWSSWELWEACSTTCDVGMQRRHRNCSNPAPLGNGRQCLGVDNEQKLYMPGPCSTQAVDGSWSSWELWEACSTTCDVGMQRRHRTCSNPAPLGNGRQCLGVDNEQKLCMPGPCSTQAVDGSWSSWELWEACSTTCDVGMQRRHRNCSNPAPLGNGRQCLGVDNEQRLCMPGPCSTQAVDGSWSNWELWEACSTTCDVGMQRRHRNCSNPAPLGNGRQCLGVDNEKKLCMPGPCSSTNAQAVDGSWSSWELWEACSTTCDVGMQRRHRNCSNPAPLGNGRQCHGVDNEQKLCMPGPCSNGGWSAWNSWGSCSASCNVGLKSRFRTCTNPRPSLFGNFCEGDNMQVEICESNPCKETHVAFSVYKSSVTNNSGQHTVVFTETLLNEGGAYDETTGVFTAPFSGLYQFNGQICTVVGKDAEYTLKTERMSFASGEHRTPSDASDGKCTSFSAVASVLKYEKVWIKSHHLFQNDNDWNSFSGILIYKT